ncbi:MAG: FMN-binding protein [Tissierellia bacterium]|nr:FMN-binding protein [Tissierellia bacterium]
MKKFVVVLVMIMILSGCGQKPSEPVEYKDGNYTGESAPDEWGGKLVAHLTVEGGKIIECTIENLDNNGVEKGEDYGKVDGKITNPGLYQIAQNAVEVTKDYPKELLETQDIKLVDVISGATVSHKAFQEAVQDALSEEGGE